MTISPTTPGVYVTDVTAFPPSVVGVETAVPIFVGYTEKAMNPATGEALDRRAVPISSLADYAGYFGGPCEVRGIVEQQPAETPPASAGTADFNAASSTGSDAPIGAYAVYPWADMAGGLAVSGQFNLYAAMQLFFANGGGNCFVISVGNYWGTGSAAPAGSLPSSVCKADLLEGLAVANETRGGTMLVVPDACLLVTYPPGGEPWTCPDYQPVAVEMLRQSATLGDRVAILDLPGALVPGNWSADAMKVEAEAFHEAIAPAQSWFSYGATYAPALQSSVLSAGDLPYTALKGTGASTALMNNLLTTQALALYPPTRDPDQPDIRVHSAAFQAAAAHIAAAFPVPDAAAIPSVPADVTGTTSAPVLEVSMASAAVPAPAATDAAAIQALNGYLLSAVPLLADIQVILASKLNVVPPSGAMAGVWAQNDRGNGVWTAPANISLNEVVKPMVVLNDEQQGGYNMPVNGNSIGILRMLTNRGTVVWGARTLDGNSADYRYIQVRRTLIYIEQSIKQALQQFAFAPNDGGTWATVTATVSNFLTGLWQAGGLMGAKASEAFTVACGVPTTMSGIDVLNGNMIVNVTVQMIHPAEFIELTFTQSMQGV